MRTRFARLVAMLAVANLLPLATQSVVPQTRAVSINFDHVAAPCVFNDTVAAREEYAVQGVHFLAPALHNGGGILNECGNFGVSGYSSPNFLAFNRSSLYSDLGIPKPPERVLFDAAYSHVQLNAGSAFVGTKFHLRAFDASGVLIGSTAITLTSAVQVVSIDATGIRSITFFAGAEYWVVDDLAAS